MLDTSITFPFFFFFFLFSFLIFSVSINFKIFLVSGTYDTSMPSEESVVNWFNVRKSSDETMAMLLDVTVSEEEEAPACWDDAAKQVEQLVETYKEYPGRVTDFMDVWRYCDPQPGEVNGEDEGMAVPRTHFDKMRISILAKIPATLGD
eukprot:Colp12_sorted_trinity150504_noHs@924